MGSCCIRNCNQKHPEKRSYFLFPRNDLRRKQWLRAISGIDTRIKGKFSRICERHFKKSDFITETIGNDARGHDVNKKKFQRKRIKLNAVPSIFIDADEREEYCVIYSIIESNSLDAQTDEEMMAEDVEIEVPLENNSESNDKVTPIKTNQLTEMHCRSCLQKGTEMETITSLTSLPGFEELFKFFKLDCAFENLPNWLCDNCVLQLYNILNFKRQCDKSYESLQETVTNNLPAINLKGSIKNKKCHACLVCNKQFQTEKWLLRHTIIAHGVEESLLQCAPCKLSNGSKADLQFHDLEGHDNICSTCQLKFSTVFHLAKHRLIYLNKVKEKEKSVKRKETLVKKYKKPEFSCNKCLLTFKSNYSLCLHLRREHEPRVRVSCPKCTRFVYNLKLHLKRH